MAQDVKKESKHLTIQQLESVVDARNPFEVAPVVEKQYQTQEKEYQELVAKIEKRVTELEEEKAKQEAVQNGSEYVPTEQSFEEKVQEEIQKIIRENQKTKTPTNTTTTNKNKDEKLVGDAKITPIVETRRAIKEITYSKRRPEQEETIPKLITALIIN